MTSPIDDFFGSFPDFPYNPQGRPTAEFQRLAQHRGWSKRGKPYRNAHGRFFRAFEREFNTTFADWSYLCEVLGIDVPSSKTQARKAVASIHVNIFDLRDYEKALKRGDDPELQRFPNVRELADYSIDEDLIYPKKLAKQEGALKFMLRKIFRMPRPDDNPGADLV